MLFVQRGLLSGQDALIGWHMSAIHAKYAN